MLLGQIHVNFLSILFVCTGIDFVDLTAKEKEFICLSLNPINNLTLAVSLRAAAFSRVNASLLCGVFLVFCNFHLNNLGFALYIYGKKFPMLAGGKIPTFSGVS